jgi:hypothetical protein
MMAGKAIRRRENSVRNIGSPRPPVNQVEQKCRAGFGAAAPKSSIFLAGRSQVPLC